MLADYLILLASVVLPVGFMLAFVWGLNWLGARKRLRVPVAEKLLRAPGESLRRQLEELDDRLTPELIVTFVGPFMFTSLILAQQRSSHPLGPAGMAIHVAVGVVAFAVVCWRVARLRKRRVRLRLGFLGERAVGEELNLLMREGAHVFHDVPGTSSSKWNIDHVLVAPTGIYAVETKTRRKREQIPGGETAHKVVYDGRTLRFPGGRAHGGDLDQARRQASSLADELSKAIGEPVAVQPILALPGWFVDRAGRGDVIVVSAKALKCLVKGKAVLDQASIQRIVHQLDRRCRDVEF